MNYGKILKQLRKKPRVHGYVSPFAETRLSAIHGLGLFAIRSIKKGDVVAIWGGRVTTSAEVQSLPKDIGYHYALQLHPGFYLAERSTRELDSADFINHSCSPNCKIVNTFVMVAERTIRAQEELTADFSSDSQEGESFECSCGTRHCSGTIYFD